MTTYKGNGIAANQQELGRLHALGFPADTCPGRGSPVLLHGRIDVGPGVVLKSRKGRAIKVADRIGQGGEGTVFNTDAPDLVAKIYKPSSLTEQRRKKLDLMVTQGIDLSHPQAKGICWPCGLLFDEDRTFRGYLMQRAQGTPIGQCLFIRQQLKSKFPRWDRRQLVRLCITVLERFVFLHAADVIVGDINPQNILVKDERNVFFVDTDSHQIDAYPCPVGTAHFTPPELQGVDFGTRMRTCDHEHFALATLLFMMLLLGKQPYAQRGGDTPIENIKGMKFAYPLRRNSHRNAPAGQYRFAWSNFPFRVKEAFFETFDGSFRGQPRRSAREWLRLMRMYDFDLEKGHVSRQFFPSELKKVSVHAQQNYGVTADDAGRRLACEDCGKDFIFTVGEQDFYRAKGLFAPRRCRKCRTAKRNDRLVASQQQRQRSPRNTRPPKDASALSPAGASRPAARPVGTSLATRPGSLKQRAQTANRRSTRQQLPISPPSRFRSMLNRIFGF